jgi:hypothetical protein
MPTYREAANIEARTYAGCGRPLASSSVLVVDDDGGDGTADRAEQAWAGSWAGSRSLRRPGKGGLASAYRAGFVMGAGARL